MGVKGDQRTKNSDLTTELLIDRLGVLDGITSKKMFGGHGVFHNGVMFALVDSKGKAFMKAGDSNRADFEAHGAEQHSRMPYFNIPDEVFNNPEMLVSWANKSIQL